MGEKGAMAVSELLCFFITLAVAVIVGTVFYKLGFPAGAMVGALIGVSALIVSKVVATDE